MSMQVGKSAELKAKAEKLEKLRREKLLRDSNKAKEDKEKASTAAKNDQEAIEKLLLKARTYEDEMKEKEREANIKQKLEQRMDSPLKRQLVNTVANFVGELTIPPKVKFAMYDKPVQAGDDISIGIGSDEPGEIVPPAAASSPQHFRPSTVHPPGTGKKDIESDGLFKMVEDLKTGDLKDSAQKTRTSNVGQDVSKEALKTIIASPGFNDFLERSSKIIERVLQNPAGDVVIDYFGDSSEPKEKIGKVKEKLAYQFTFPDEKVMENFNRTRIVTDIEWMSKHPDLLLVSYNKGEESAIGEQDGLVNIWATTLRTRPECSLICQSEVTKAISHPYRPNEIIGGTYAGYVVLWDIRAKRTPVLKSQLTSDAHSFPIYSLAIVGTEKANTIISVANNGRICVWPMEMFTTPQRAFDLKYNAKEVCATCIGFPQEESNDFYVGAEDNSVYCGQVHSTGEMSKENSGIIESYPSHYAPVTSLSLHPTPAAWTRGHEYSHIMLTSSMDWSVKLWNPKIGKSPIASFESAQDYVLDVKWCPTHPSVFASCDAEGYVDVWDLNTDMESPVLHHRKDPIAVHRLAWSADGKRLAAGGVNGTVSVYNVDKEYAKPRAEEFTKFERMIQSNSTVGGSIGGSDY